MGTKPEIIKPKRSRSFHWITKLKPKPELLEKHEAEAEAEALAFLKHEAEAEAEDKIFQAISKLWLFETMKPKLKPKLWLNHEAEAEDEAEALTFLSHEAEAEADVLASKASALWTQSRNSFVPMSDKDILAIILVCQFTYI